MLVVAVINVDVYPFLAFPDLTCQLQDTGIGVFWLHCATAGFSQALFDLGVFLKLSLIEKKQWIVSQLLKNKSIYQCRFVYVV